MQRNSAADPAARICHQFIASLLVVTMAVMTGGCETARDYSLTRKLWSPDVDFDGPAHHPAANSDVQLFESTNPPDILVQYNEAQDNEKHTKRRAYFLLENQNRTGANRKPRFVSPDTAASLPTIPLRNAADPPASSSPPAPLYAVIRPNENRLTLHGEHWDQGPYTLPHYSTSRTTTARVAITPLALAGDVVMVGLAAGFVGAMLWISAGAPTGNCR